ncbi:MAG TPA: iron-containing alcohol dehydrogenase [Candidatus Binatia bacterium]|nr:iron-containing alcohol dehydrogenase [Candidatus Binatia bacterium]
MTRPDEASTRWFDLRILAYRALKPLQWPVSRVVAIPRPAAFVGPDSAIRLCAMIGNSGARRVMIVTDAVLVQLGLIEPIRSALAGHGIDVAVHDAITPDPTYPVLEAGLQAVRAHRSDAILAVGGGSVIDAAKVIDAMAVTGKRPEKLLGVLKVSKPMLPLYAIPTTAGTGSEVTVAAVVTDPVKHAKAAVIDPKLVPTATALDPTLMRGMPPAITAATGLDALTHAVEAYVNRWPHAETKAHCLSATRMIFSNLPRAYAHGDDLAAREAMAIAAYYAGLAFTKAYVGWVHAFSHKIGGMYGVPHGLANAITLPYVLDFLASEPAVQARLADLAVAIGAGQADEPASALAVRFIERVRELNRTVGIPDKIAALRPGDVPEIARAAMIEAHRDYPVPKNMTLEEAEALLGRMLPST